MELRRLIFDEQMRSEKRKSAGTAIESQVTGSLKPWREVVTPHQDVASGRYQQAEFAADLWQVYLGEGSDEYRDPIEFFRRTFLTEESQGVLIGAVLRLAGQGGDPVWNCRPTSAAARRTRCWRSITCFRDAPTELAGIDTVMNEAGATKLSNGKARVLVGNKISPGNPSKKPDGTVVRTLWGELAWQLGGKKAFARIQADDEKATSPGDVLRELFNEYAPCLILIDEWVAYARQLHDQSDLPAGQFDTQFTFAQALTEVGEAGEQLSAGDQPSRLRYVGLASHESRRCRSRRSARTRGAGSATQCCRTRRIFLAAGQRRRRLRDCAATAVRADGRSGAIQGPRRRGARLRGPLPDAAPGIPA